MGAVDLDAVESGGLGATRGGGELADHQVDIGLLHHLDLWRLGPAEGRHLFRQEVADEVPLHRRRIAGRPERDVESSGGKAGRQPPVMQLGGDLCAVAVNPRHQLRQTRQEPVVRNRRLIGQDRAMGPGHAGHARHDQSGAAPGLLFMIGDEPLAADAVLLRKADAHGGDDDAVLGFERADPAARQQMGIARHSQSPCASAEAARSQTG